MATPTKLIMGMDSLLNGLYYLEGEINNAAQRTIHRWRTSYTLGTGNGQVNRFVNPGTPTGKHNEIILAGAAQNFDFFGSLVDGLGNTINLTTIKELLIVNMANPKLTPTYNLTITGNLFNGMMAGFTSITLLPGDIFRIYSPRTGYTVTNTSQERLTLNPGANSFHVFVAALGVG